MVEGRDFPKIISSDQLDNPRLIDDGVYFFNASLQGFAERYSRAVSTHTIHVWWARRPHNAMLPLVFASLVHGIDDESVDLMRELSFKSDNLTDLLKKSNEQLRDEYSRIPEVLDIFGGGGTIPQSAASLGLNSYSIDINPLSVFIQKCYIEYYPQIEIEKSELLKLIEDLGTELLENLQSNTDSIFPARQRDELPPIAYLWSYVMECNHCSYKFYLSRRPWISKKMSNKQTKNQYIALQLQNKEKQQEVNLQTVQKEEAKLYQRSYENDSPVDNNHCPKCNEVIDLDVSNAEDTVMVKIYNHGYGKGKSFALTNSGDYDSHEVSRREAVLLTQLDIDPEHDFPKIPQWSGVTNPTLYGIETYYEILNPRQRVILLELIALLDQNYQKITDEYDEKLARVVVGILSSLIDQLVDWNCRLTMWISQNLQPGRAFSGPGVPMYWDYCEIDPLQNGPANLHDKLKRILKGLNSLPDNMKKGNVDVGDAADLKFPDEKFDAVVTDPPYYDNIFYSILADFIYSWKYQLFESIIPELFQENSSHNSKELVASTQRNDQDSLLAHEFYTKQMSKALQEVERVLRSDGVLAFVYSHKSLKGWLAIVEAFIHTGLQVTSVQPLTIERKARPRAMNSESIDSCLVFVAHKIQHQQIVTRFESIEEMKANFIAFGREIDEKLSKLEFDPADIGLTIFANGAAILSNIKELQHIQRERLYDYLLEVETMTTEIIPGFKLTSRSSI